MLKPSYEKTAPGRPSRSSCLFSVRGCRATRAETFLPSHLLPVHQSSGTRLERILEATAKGVESAHHPASAHHRAGTRIGLSSRTAHHTLTTHHRADAEPKSVETFPSMDIAARCCHSTHRRLHIRCRRLPRRLRCRHEIIIGLLHRRLTLRIIRNRCRSLESDTSCLQRGLLSR